MSFLNFKPSHHKILVPKGPHVKTSVTRHIFGNQFIVSTIRFRKCFSKFMIPIALWERFGRKAFISSVEVRNIIADSS